MHHRFLFGAFILLIVGIAVLAAGVRHVAAPPPPPPVIVVQQPAFPAQPPGIAPQPPVVQPPQQPRPVVPVAAPAPAQTPPPDRIREVEGRGRTENDAQQRALANAGDSVESFLKERFPDVQWESVFYLIQKQTQRDRDGYLQDIGVVRIDKPTEKDFADLGKGYEAIAHIDVSDANLRKMQQKVDEARLKDPKLVEVVQSRHWLVYRILASLVALFLVVFGYIKLEELTRGYYTTLLRLGAGAVVLLTVLGLFVAL